MSNQRGRVTRRDEEHPYRRSAKRIIDSAVALEEDDITELIHEEISKYRLDIYAKWVNEVVVVEVGGLEIECLVHDVKVVNDYPEYQVTPLVGEGNIWVKGFKSRRNTPMKKKK